MAEPADPDARGYDEALAAWLRQVIAEHAARKPWIRPCRPEDLDGCTLVPDDCRWACLLHDVRYWFAEAPAERLEADRLFRADVVSTAIGDPGWLWLWWLRASAAYLAVRSFGWIVIARHQARRAREAAASSSTSSHPERKRMRKIMSGTQAKLVGGALAVVLCYAWSRLATPLPGEVGSAVSVILVALVDIALAGGEPTEPKAS